MTTDISAIIPTWRRPDSLAKAITTILACEPPPTEVLVHVDAGDEETVLMLEREFVGKARWFSSESTQGPGGSRNLLIREAKSLLVAGFDDDSWPLDRDYFAVAAELFHSHPRAAVFSGQMVLPGIQPRDRGGSLLQVNCYSNCASVLRRDAFLDTRGHLPLRYAYGMEESDVALQLLDAGWELLTTPTLRVYHDVDLEHHASKALNAAYIRNTALLAYLRYPVRYWALGALQILSRVRLVAWMGLWRGIVSGVWQIPAIIWCYRKDRKPVCAATMALSRELGRENKRRCRKGGSH